MREDEVRNSFSANACKLRVSNTGNIFMQLVAEQKSCVASCDCFFFGGGGWGYYHLRVQQTFMLQKVVTTA